MKLELHEKNSWKKEIDGGWRKPTRMSRSL
jgi:hypothetical protein